MQDLNHKHIVITANNLAAPPRTAVEVEQWLSQLVDKVGMKVLMGPYATRCDTEGNEGCTGIVCIETSHASIHVWDTGCAPFAKMDLYSCKDFAVDDVVAHFSAFQPSSVDLMVIDRNEKNRVIVSQTVNLHPLSIKDRINAVVSYVRLLFWGF